MTQENIVFGIISFASVSIALRFFRAAMAGPLSEWLLKHGHVKWAMRVRKQKTEKCGNCR